MSLKKIEKYLADKKIFKNPKIKKFTSGTNYQTFLIKDGRKKYILRLVKKSVVSNDRLEKAYYVLRFVEREGINFSEKMAFFDPTNNILITTYIEGDEISLASLNNKQLKQFISKFIKVSSLKYKNFEKFLSKEKIELDILEDPPQRINRLLTKRLNYIKRHFKNKKILGWLKKELLFTKNLYKDTDWGKKELLFDHGDLAGANIFLKKNGKLIFIDWDNSRFTHDIGFILANMFYYSGDITEKFQNKFISLYAKEANLDEKQIKEEVQKGFRVIMLGGIIWALRMYIKTKKKGNSEWKKYDKMVKDRINGYKYYF